jgi:hypothetical protein
MKNLIAIIAIMFACAQTPVLARDIFDEPFLYLQSPGVIVDNAIWFIRPVALQSWIEIERGKQGFYEASFLSGTGAGIAWERNIAVNGKYYSTFSFALTGLFYPILQEVNVFKFSGAMTVSTLDGLIGGGVRFDGKSCSGMLVTTIKIF